MSTYPLIAHEGHTIIFSKRLKYSKIDTFMNSLLMAKNDNPQYSYEPITNMRFRITSHIVVDIDGQQCDNGGHGLFAFEHSIDDFLYINNAYFGGGCFFIEYIEAVLLGLKIFKRVHRL